MTYKQQKMDTLDSRLDTESQIKALNGEKKSLLAVLKQIRLKIEQIIGIIYCFLGFHGWTLDSGLPGSSKYSCRRCSKKSKERW